MTPNTVSTNAGLRSIYGSPPPTSLAIRCILPQLDRHHRAFIALSPFIVIASDNARGAPDVSPRGDMPGFVAVPSPHTLVIPDRPGNKKLATLSNILENPALAVIFFIPGRTESLRVNGKAHLTTDPAQLGRSPLVEERHKARLSSRSRRPSSTAEGRSFVPASGKPRPMLLQVRCRALGRCLPIKLRASMPLTPKRASSGPTPCYGANRRRTHRQIRTAPFGFFTPDWKKGDKFAA